ncbi:MAG: type II toxin-antitoxin system RelE/ParE family toxin [Victivallaceae bacterium]|nr:type II toxin-antitoxin system RelE/ParE family toxin [Victivallaceae bacterium]
MKAKIIATDNFQKEAKRLLKKYNSLKDELTHLAEQLTEQPTFGIHLGSSCYKIRIAVRSKGKGKSGGARIITTYKITNNIVYLLSIYDKSEFDTISDKNLKRLIKDTNFR